MTRSKENSFSKFETTEVHKKTIIDSRYISGKIIPKKEVKIVSHISGIISEIYIEEGEYVKIGDSIARVRIFSSPEAIANATKNLSITKLNYEFIS